jgi:DNA-binding beta-propeller fold protein YncE
LPHPVDVVFKDGALYIADTYNSKIKTIDPTKRVGNSFAGTGLHGYADGVRFEKLTLKPTKLKS